MNIAQKKPYRIDVHKNAEDGLFIARCLDIPGLIIQGDTVEHTIEEVKLILPDMFELDDTLPALEQVEFEFNVNENDIE